MKRLSIPTAATLALAAAGAQAQAPSAVTLYGLIDVGVHARQLSGQQRSTNVDSGVMETSFIGFRGSEDLGGGLRANFDLASFFTADNGGATRGIPGENFWSKTAWVGLSGAWGTVRLGRITTANFLSNMRFSPFGGSATISPTFLHTYIGSAAQPMTTGSGVTDSAWSNSLAYTSPNLAGVVATLQAAAGEGTTLGRRLGGSVAYSGGDFAAMLSFDRVSRAALAFPLAIPTLPGAVPPFTASDFSTVQLGLSYDLKAVKLFGQVSRTGIEGTRPGPPGMKTIDLDTVQLGVSVPFGSGRLLASAARTNKAQTDLDERDRTTLTVGYDHDLSRRTDLYAAVMSDKVDDLARGTGCTVGIRHRF
jgi:predicted porin